MQDKEYKNKWYQENKHKYKEYYAKNRESHIESSKKYYRKHANQEAMKKNKRLDLYEELGNILKERLNQEIDINLVSEKYNYSIKNAKYLLKLSASRIGINLISLGRGDSEKKNVFLVKELK